ncbi:MAG: AAA family ATPase [Pseudomonadota bacterium]
MLIKRGYGDFPKIYRPCSPHELYGQEEIKQIMTNKLGKGAFGHSYLFHGTYGTGKTTCARIIGMGLLCKHGPTSRPCCTCEQCKRIMTSSNPDFFELNNANFTGIDFMRNLKTDFHYAPFMARHKVFVFDECHRITEATQNMLLKEVEDVFDGVYFIFCSSDPEKIIEPLKNRCMSVEFRPVNNDEIRQMLIDVCNWEGINYQNVVMESIIQEAQGLPRNALFLLQKAVDSGKVKKTDSISPYLIRHVQNKGRTLLISPFLVSDGTAFGKAIKDDVAKQSNGHEITDGQILNSLPKETAVMLRIFNRSLMCIAPTGVVNKGLTDMIKDNAPDILSLLGNKDASTKMLDIKELKEESKKQANSSLTE